jgi:hypothetical protein
MTYYRLLLLSFLTVSWIFLCGLKKPVDHNEPTVETQKTEVELKSIETDNNTGNMLETKQVKAKSNVKPVKVNPKNTTVKTTDAGVADDINPVKRDEFEKPLDLSVPFNHPENADLKIEQKSSAQNGVTNIFAPESKKKRRPLEVDGDFLMSPEPEAGKQKTVDGAGLVIKLKP